MRGFIVETACKGKRPAGVFPVGHRCRQRLIKRMLVERCSPCFIVGPDGFGKTALAAEYAETVRGFVETFWIPCQSPCFLRDLDSEQIARSLKRLVRKSGLVVFDDLPFLDEDRAPRFSHVIDELVAAGWEVVVTLRPLHDVFGDLQQGRSRIGPFDLLLDRAEIEECLELPGLDGRREGALSITRLTRQSEVSIQVPSLAWGGEGGRAQFVQSLKDERPPLDVRLNIFVMLVLGIGQVADLRSACGQPARDSWGYILGSCPYVRVDQVEDSFTACALSIEDIARAYRESISGMAAASPFETQERLCSYLAERLCCAGNLQRAARLVGAFCPKKPRLRWIRRMRAGYFSKGEMLAMERLYESLGTRPVGVTFDDEASQVERLYLLGDAQAACQVAFRCVLGTITSTALAARVLTVVLICRIPEHRDKSVSLARRAMTMIERELSTPAAQEALAKGEAAAVGESAGDTRIQAGLLAKEDALAVRESGEDQARAARKTITAYQGVVARQQAATLLSCALALRDGLYEQCLELLSCMGDALRKDWLGAEILAQLLQAPSADSETGATSQTPFSGSDWRVEALILAKGLMSSGGLWPSTGVVGQALLLDALGTVSGADGGLRQTEQAYLRDMIASLSWQRTQWSMACGDTSSSAGGASLAGLFSSALQPQESDWQDEGMPGRQDFATQSEAVSLQAPAEGSAGPSLQVGLEHGVNRAYGGWTCSPVQPTALGCGLQAASGVGHASVSGGMIRTCDGSAFAIRPSYGTESTRIPSGLVGARLAGSRGIDPLYVRMFGGFEVSRGEECIDPARFVRQKAKTLLAILALNRGKEVSRSEILRAMWPDMPKERSVRNFYTVWSQMRHALMLETGECPYVARHQNCCKVEARLVHTDLEEFDALCRTLLFGSIDGQDWLGILTRLKDHFAAGLLPAEEDNALILMARQRYETQMVDAFVAGCERLCDVLDFKNALWFGRAAVEFAPDREDGYCALMWAQIEGGQLSAAMATYETCRGRLRDHLGIDPSARLMELHQQLVNARGSSLVRGSKRTGTRRSVIK
ncbi:MAG: BTAD domain-containing putative transcriptional regulator [Eggerthellales bacterium]|nr:BTAD domain-containing putative transcriptional regulator [Eggerthellales bacterium]